MEKLKGVAPEKMSSILNVRYTPAQRLRVKERAEAAGTTETEFIRALSLDAPLKGLSKAPTVDRELLARALGAAGEIGGLLREILAIVHADEEPFARTVRHLAFRIEQMADAVLAALGK